MRRESKPPGIERRMKGAKLEQWKKCPLVEGCFERNIRAKEWKILAGGGGGGEKSVKSVSKVGFVTKKYGG